MKPAHARPLRLVLLVCLLLIGHHATAQGAAQAERITGQPQQVQQGDGQPDTYEYAQLLHVWSRGVDSQNYVVWSTPQQRIEAERLTDVYDQLGGTLPSRQVALIEVFNLLGSQGWELVFSPGWFRSGDETNTNTYLFRRLPVEEGQEHARFECAQLFIWNLTSFWKTDGQKIDADTFEQLYEQMEIRPREEPSVQAMLDALEQEGWQPVVFPDSTEEVETGNSLNYYFARPAED